MGGDGDRSDRKGNVRVCLNACVWGMYAIISAILSMMSVSCKCNKCV